MILKGKVAIVTGASAGIGAATALRFAREGCDLSLITARNLEGLKKTERACREAGRRVIAFLCDISSLPQIDLLMERTVSELGGLDILVNNAATHVVKSFEETQEEDFARIFSTNVKGLYFCCQKAVPHMLKRGGGKIVNITSTFGSVGSPGFSALCTSKGAVIHLTQALALELAPQGIAVNALAPGATGTETVLAFYGANPHIRERRLRDIPAGRIGTPEEVAEAALFLASKASDYIHGHNLVVDGGYLIH